MKELIIALEEVSKREYMRITLTSEQCKIILKEIERVNKMKKLREEIQKAEEKMNEASKEYIKKSTKRNYEWYTYCQRYYEGLKKAFNLIEGE